MAIAIDRESKNPYILESDRKLPKSDQTIFYLRPLTAREQAALIAPHLNDKGELEMGSEAFSDLIDLVDAALVGWENFKKPDGIEIPYNKDTGILQSDKGLRPTDYMSIGMCTEIATEIFSLSSLTDDDRKN